MVFSQSLRPIQTERCRQPIGAEEAHTELIEHFHTLNKNNYNSIETTGHLRSNIHNLTKKTNKFIYSQNVLFDENDNKLAKQK